MRISIPEWWDDRLAELTHMMRWTPDVVEQMTESETLRWLDRARRLGKRIGVGA